MNSAAINKVPAPCHIPVETGHPRMDKIVPVLPHRVYGPSWSRPLGFAKSLSQVRSGESHGNPLQYSCLENPVDRGAWWAAVQGVAKSWIERVLYMSIRLFWFIVVFRSSVSVFLSGWSIYYWEWSIEVFSYYCGTIYFSLQFFQLLLHIFWW